MPRLPAITLVSALLLALSTIHTIPAAHALQPIGAERMIRRYTHHNIHYRQLLEDVVPEGEEDPADPAAPADPAGSSAAGGGATQSSPAQQTSTRAGGGGIIGGIGTAIGGGGASSATETRTTTEQPASSTTERPTSTRTSVTQTRAPTTQPPPQQSSSSSATPRTTSTRIVYDDATPEQQQEIKENREYQSGLSRIPENVRTILIVVASVLAALIIVWTAVRKWKLRSSQSFQSRLAPIDWQPDNDKDKLTPPPAMAEISDKDSIRRNMFAPDGPSLAPPPHDFTAGPGSYSRSASPMPYGAHTASPVPFRTDSPAPSNLQRYPSNGSSGRGYEPSAHGYDPSARGYDPAAYNRGY